MDIQLEWTSHPNNPLIKPAFPEWLLGDPAVLQAEDSPDGHWHLFANTVLWVYHYTSPDGIRWKRRDRVCHGMRPFLYREGGGFFLFYEMHYLPTRSVIMARGSADLYHWGPARKVLSAERSWEREVTRTVSCPCIVRAGDTYRLYYSAGSVFLRDLGFCEPLYIGCAEADSLLGPYRKRPEPLLGPEQGHPYRNRGAGAIKVYRDADEDRWVGFNNGIYGDESGRSRSAISILTSEDGFGWHEPLPEPVIKPTHGWKEALVYQLSLVTRPNGEIWLYYNARDGWRFGRERIGLEIGRPSEASGQALSRATVR
jgi:hypothetical protein